ncbi:glycosyltransferase family 4 protein [Nocardioides mangrovi]|uniref:Glycosyltransferase family 4 protein n=1 Tax=Nocardioides mangrovi TaxID=2874580 RepID=A0ABS7UAA5_9ACTN|nr:glycosyltransferase family 4 protein [Nocardioides mangrovi]MBZ5737661.1 glycosyltransferase family 4 protein [Nocardioides mangrovi]
MRAAVVTPRFPPDAGGVEEYAAWVARTLRDAGHDVLVVTTGRGRRRTETTYDGMRVVRLGTWLTVSNTPVHPAWPVQLRRLLADVDVVSAHAPVPGLADLAAYVSAAPVVLTYHSGSMVKGGHPADPLLRAYERRVLPRVLDRCRELVAVSPASLAHATGRAHLLPPGVDTTVFGPGDEPRGRGVLYVGRLERTSRWKGVPVLLDALPRLRDLVPGARLDVVGDGDDVEALQKHAADLGVADLVTWHGRVDHAALAPHYRRAGVTVLPSLTESEAFGMTLAEAMACGSPVVGTTVGGIPYAVRDGVDGRLVPPGDAVALADALAQALTDPVTSPDPQRWAWERQADRTVRLLEGAVR